MEEDMYKKFATVVNKKKEKIRELQQQLREARQAAEVAQAAAAANSLKGTIARGEKAEAVADSDCAGSSSATSSEAPKKSPAKRGRPKGSSSKKNDEKTATKRSGARQPELSPSFSLKDDTDLSLLDEEEVIKPTVRTALFLFLL